MTLRSMNDYRFEKMKRVKAEQMTAKTAKEILG